MFLYIWYSRGVIFLVFIDYNRMKREVEYGG